MWSGERMTRIQATSRPDHFCHRFGQEWLKEKLAAGCWKTEARRYNFIDPEDMEVQGKTRGQRWNCFWKQPCLARFQNLGHGEACGENKPNIRISRNVCFVEPLESTRKRLERTLPKDHEECIAGMGFNWLVHQNLVHKFMPMHQAMHILDAKAAVDKEWEKLEKLPAWHTKDVLCSEVTLWRTILAHTLHSPSTVRQHHKWRPQK